MGVAVLFFFVSFCLAVSGNDTNRTAGENLTWSFNNGYLTINGTGNMYSFAEFGSPWEKFRTEIKYIVVDDGVTSIGDFAFASCYKLVNVSIPSSITSIGVWAFNSCWRLEGPILLPANVSFIGHEAFSGCKSLKSFVVDSDNANYSSDANGVLFDNNKETLIQYPSGSGESNYSIPSSAKRIEDFAFWGANNLAAIVLDGNNSVFMSHDGVLINIVTKTLVLHPPNRKNTYYEIPNGINVIEGRAFNDCKSLNHVVLPVSLTTIGIFAFQNTNLLTVTIPATVSSIGKGVFENCPLSSIVVDQGNMNYSSIDGVLFDHERTTLLQYPKLKTNESYTVPSSVHSISESAFFGNTFLRKVKLNNCVTTIGKTAFKKCSKLENISLSNNLTYIGMMAFSESGLSSIVIPKSVTVIGERAFEKCSNLTSVYYFGDTEISSNAFDSFSGDVCISPDYKYSQFCGKIISLSPECETLRRMFNRCFEVAYVDEEFILEERDDATIWKNQSNNCLMYDCDNESGLIWRSLCSSTDTTTRMCMDNQCVEGKPKDDKAWTVDVEFDQVKVVVTIPELIDTILHITGVDKDDIEVGVEMNEEGEILSVHIYTDSEETAEMVNKNMLYCLTPPPPL